MGLPVRTRRLSRTDLTDDMLGGVCGGIALYLDVDSTLVRVATVIAALATGLFPAVIVYIALAFIMRSELDV